MKSKHCEACSEWWPLHHITCPICSKQCESSSKSPMPIEEYKWLLYTKKGRISAMPKSEQEKADAEWAALEAEVERRKGHWSIVDLIEDGFRATA